MREQTTLLDHHQTANKSEREKKYVELSKIHILN